MDSKRDWPLHIDSALYTISCYGDEEAEDFLADFRKKWGSLDTDALMRAAALDRDTDREFAILALGSARAREATPLLVTLLSDPEYQARWLSTIALSRMGDRSAVPGLCKMLTEYLPVQLPSGTEHGLSEGERFWLEYYRGNAPHDLFRFGDPTTAPALRDALVCVSRLLHREVFTPEDAEVYSQYLSGTSEPLWKMDSAIREYVYDFFNAPIRLPPTLQLWRDDRPLGSWGGDPVDDMHRQVEWMVNYEESILLALGRIGALGALSGIPLAPPIALRYMTYLAAGALSPEYSADDLSYFQGRPPERFMSDVRRFLAQHFGLSTSEQEEALLLANREVIATLKSTINFMRHEEKQGRTSQ